MKRVVIVGCGAVAYRWYFKGIQESDYCRAVALVDPDERALKKAGKYLAIKNLYSSIDHFFNSGIKADIALVLTPHSSHYNVVKKCLLNNLNVYCEKPFAENRFEGRELVELAKLKNLKLAAAPQIKLSSRNKAVKSLLESEVIGKVALVRASGSNMGPADRVDTNYNPKWFYNDGGSLASLGIYTLTLINYLFGKPKRVASFSGISFENRTVKYGPNKGEDFTVTAPDNQIAILDYGEGMYVLFDGSYVVKNPVEYELTIHGEKGTILVGGFGGPESIVLIDSEGNHFVGPDDDCHINWNLFWGVEDLAKCLEESGKLIVDGESALDVIEIMDAMKKSNNQNKIFSFELEE
ncbi:TPA: Gfo/Idh/MocA family oxidoreductase [Streptococcus suis]|nr:Gfo/Idh/MocA family oxidoreductase [Streptococcus suis]HEM3711855.1 Gfo/Idh/MocA family oxidoreductase [Streptococcus suis]